MATDTVARPTHAWFSLVRLGGCNYKAPITRKGKSIIVGDPQGSSRRYRINAALFDAGKRQFRNSWCIQAWGEKAERTAEAERNWQT